MYTRLDKCMLEALKNCSKKKNILKQIEKSCIKVFKDACYTLLLSSGVKLNTKDRKKLSRYKQHINKIIFSPKHRRSKINQHGGLILPFLIPLIKSLI